MSPSRTVVVTDSTAYLPDELAAEHGIHRVSLYVTLEGEQRREADISPDEYGDFYERLRASDEGATTSQPSVGDFVAVYEPLLAEGAEIVSIHLSAGISGTCDSARQARDQLVAGDDGGERIHVVDSRTAGGGAAFVVLVAARAAAAGASATEAVEAARQARESLQIWFAVDTLEYLRKGGRIGGAQALLGSALQVKPILTLGEQVAPVERVRTRRRAFERLVEYARERERDGAGTWIVQHIRDHDRADRLVAEGREIFGSDPVFVSEIGPVIGVHAGPGLLGVGGITTGLLD